MHEYPNTTLTACEQALDWNRELFPFSDWMDTGEQDPGLVRSCGLVLPNGTTIAAHVVEVQPGQFEARVSAFDEDDTCVLSREFPRAQTSRIEAQRHALKFAAAWCLMIFADGTL